MPVNLAVTTTDPQGRRADHLLDVPDSATVAELGSVLGAADLFLGSRRLNPDVRVGASGIRTGALLGLDTPAPTETATRAWRPPGSDPVLVTVRHASGPGAGRVWRLGPGRHEVGTDRACALRLDGGEAPAQGTWITVATNGSVTVALPDDADEDRCGLRSLTPPPPVDPITGTPLTAEEPAGTQEGGPGGHSTEPAPPGPDGLPSAPPLPPIGWLPPPDDGSLPWPTYADLSLGEHLLRLGPPDEPEAAVRASSDGLGVEYNRPPRIAPHLDGESIRMMGPPTDNTKRPFPFLMMMAPLVMGLAMMFLFRSLFFVVFVFFTPIMALGNWVSGRRSGRKQYEEAKRVFRIRRSALELEMRRATVEERGLRNTTFPDPAAVLLTATGPGLGLWQRRRRDTDHMTIRLGTLTRASLKRIDDQARETHYRQVNWRLADVPFGVEMADFGVLGISGPGAAPRRIASWAVIQTAVLHSPRDVRIVVLTEDEHADAWQWVRWLPHLRPGRAGAAVVGLGTDPESTAHRVNELIADIQTRVDSAQSALGRTLLRVPDVLVVLDGARRLRDVPGVIEVLTTGPAVRVFSLCLEEREHQLPEECTAVVTANGARLNVKASHVPEVADVRADLVDPAWCEEVARAIAPMRDVTVDSDSGLPAEVALLPLIRQEPPDADVVVGEWARRPASTTFVLGSGYEGTLRLDLVRDGPHGLIGGTTGSGKSELLQTVIASLAAANRPDELTFVLVDYKGGSAFRECAELPHTLGMITDLDGHLVKRALASLDAELRRRETVLNEVEAKDHTEYRIKRSRDPRLPALPRLILVIDEFATLVRELPDFVPGLISLAQRGRSLGLHLLLATQRPGGSVSNEIKANTNLRIALRVTDRSESQDIIDSGDAAGISPNNPGRALVRRGEGAPTPFQTAFVGAERPGAIPSAVAEAAASRPVRGVQLGWQRLGRPLDLSVLGPDSHADPQEGGTTTPSEEQPTDLRALVDVLREAADRLPDFEPLPSPWLPALDGRLRLDDLPAIPEPEPGALPMVPYALLDIPQLQSRRLAAIDFATFGHLYIIGAPRSGRTQVLRSIAGAAALTIPCSDLHIYAIDAAGGGLGVLEALPHCGAVVSRHDAERMERLITRLSGELTLRQRLIAQHDCAGVTELRAKLPKDRRPAHLVFMVDGWDALSNMLDDYDGGRLYAEFVRLLREGQAAGIHVIATSERLLLGGRLAAHNDRRLLLRQTDPGDFTLIGIPRNSVPTHVPPGRGWFAPGAVEAQIALLPSIAESSGGRPSTEQPSTASALGAVEEGDTSAGDQSDQAEAMRDLARRAMIRDTNVPGVRRPFRVNEMPTLIGFQEAHDRVPQALRTPLRALLGVGGDAVEPLSYDFSDGAGSFMVTGPPRSGRSTALAAMCVSLLMSGTHLIVLTPRDSQLRKLAAHGLAEVLTDPDPSPEELNEALAAVEGKPVVVVVDDADLMLACDADSVLRKLATSGRDRGQGLLLAGTAESMSSLGWVGMARRSRRGLLLGPKTLGEGDLIGVRLSAEQVRASLGPGRGWTAGDAGSAIAVQVPLTVLDG
ncbi:FtsK/SpoIIIE domain-containing protein (plasmid) [Embleya sp. NBC_00888]|uniref:FtsK/SpoIIIE domain-containing protein n=1 Tax=Embleya sp. NBC_00888 TaxID=2975960 RepID=UPI002F919B7F|nr:FtsK/SpoIIIE domain-containing protein [Embleya sp. NBC_00888]